jgi:MraZ protein
VVFRGHYDYSLDVKNRLNLPPKWRGELSEGVVLVQGVDACIEMYTPAAHAETVESALQGLNRMSPEYRKITRRFVQNLQEADLDSAGRVTVTQRLLDYAGIKKAVVIGGSMDHAEIWDADAWQAEQDSIGDEIEALTEGLGHPS